MLRLQRKTKVYFILKEHRMSAKPPTIAEAEVLVRNIDIKSRNFCIIQFYSVKNYVPRHQPEWHYWETQRRNRKVLLPQVYWDQLLCYDERGETIRSIPNKVS